MAEQSFLTIAKATKLFVTSRSTIERRRDEARDKEDSDTYQHFVIRTKDGQLHQQPTKEVLAELNKAGQIPEWLISTTWLKSQFKQRDEVPDEAPLHDLGHEEGAPSQVTKVKPRQPKSELISMYEDRIKDLKEQNDFKDKMIEREREEKLKLLEFAQSDKQLFAKAAENLTQVLALPGIVQATKSERQASPAVDTKPVDTTPKPEPVTRKPRTTKPKLSTTKQNAKASPKKEQRKPGFLQRIRGIKFP